MAVRKIVGFDDVVVTGASVNANTAINGVPFTLFPGSTANGGGVTIIREDGWLKLKGGTNGSVALINKINILASIFSANMLPTGPTTEFTIGFRWSVPTGNIIDWMHPLGIMPGTISTANLAAYGIFPSAASIPDFTQGAEYYLEVTVDLTNGVYRRWVDSVSIPDLAIPADVLAALRTNATAAIFMGFGPPNTASGNREYSYWFKDMYVLEKTADGINSSRLGPQKVFSLDVAEVTAPGWTPSTGTAKDVLNTPITTAASLATPVVTTDGNSTSAAIKLAVPAIVNPVTAVAITVGASRPTGSGTTLTTSLTEGSQTTATKTTALPAAGQYGLPVYVGDNAPDNTPWTPARIANATLNIASGQ